MLKTPQTDAHGAYLYNHAAYAGKNTRGGIAMEMNEMLVKAKKAKTPEELLAIANENGVELDEEGAKAYFEQLNQNTGELSDDELDEVAGGGCHKSDGRLVVMGTNTCGDFVCKFDGNFRVSGVQLRCTHCRRDAFCKNCKYVTRESGVWICNYPGKRKK